MNRIVSPEPGMPFAFQSVAVPHPLVVLLFPVPFHVYCAAGAVIQPVKKIPAKNAFRRLVNSVGWLNEFMGMVAGSSRTAVKFLMQLLVTFTY